MTSAGRPAGASERHGLRASATVQTMFGRDMRRWAGVCSVALLAAGCDVNGLIDIGDGLLDPDAGLLDRPGRKLVSGRYSGLKIAGSAENGGYVLARRTDVDDERVAVVPFLEGDGCEYTPALDYDRFSSRINLEFPGTLSVQVGRDEDNSSFGSVRFIDYQCREVLEQIDSTILPGPLFPGIDPIGMLARKTDGTLYLIDAERRKLIEIADSVDYGVVTGPFLFTLEAGEVVVRDESLDEIDRMGSGAFSVIATGGERMPLVYEDESGVHAWSKKAGTRTLAEDGCRLGYLGVDTTAYFSPCDARRLTVTAPSDSVFADGDGDAFVTLRGPTDTIMDSLSLPIGVTSGTSPLREFLVVTQPEVGVPTGTLRALVLPDDAQPDLEEVELSSVKLDEDVTYVRRDGLYYRSYADGRGTLLDIERDEDDRPTGVVEVAANVAWVPHANPYSYRGILAEYDGREGQLLRVARSKKGKISRSVIGERVPVQNFVGDAETGLLAFVSEVDQAGVGILNIVDDLGAFEAADGVLMNEVRLLDDPEGVVFLKPTKVNGTFELHTWLVKADLDLLVHRTVSEYIPIPWPSPGVLYAVPTGDDAGLWFAKAR